MKNRLNHLFFFGASPKGEEKSVEEITLITF
jgi:hypothetical protein